MFRWIFLVLFLVSTPVVQAQKYLLHELKFRFENNEWVLERGYAYRYLNPRTQEPTGIVEFETGVLEDWRLYGKIDTIFNDNGPLRAIDRVTPEFRNSVSAKRNNVTSFQYDSLGRLVFKVNFDSLDSGIDTLEINCVEHPNDLTQIRRFGQSSVLQPINQIDTVFTWGQDSSLTKSYAVGRGYVNLHRITLTKNVQTPGGVFLRTNQQDSYMNNGILRSRVLVTDSLVIDSYRSKTRAETFFSSTDTTIGSIEWESWETHGDKEDYNLYVVQGDFTDFLRIRQIVTYFDMDGKPELVEEYEYSAPVQREDYGRLSYIRDHRWSDDGLRDSLLLDYWPERGIPHELLLRTYVNERPLVFSDMDRLFREAEFNDPFNLYPNQIRLSRNYPNPFNPSTSFNIVLDKRADISIDVFDLMGRRVAFIFEGRLGRGVYPFTFDATGLSAGIYFYRVQSQGIQKVESMSLVK